MRGPKGADGPAHPRAAADPRWVFKAHGGASLLFRMRREKERNFLGPTLSALRIWFLLLSPHARHHCPQSTQLAHWETIFPERTLSRHRGH